MGEINEILLYPRGDAEVVTQPDGRFVLAWRWGEQSVNLVLTIDQVSQLNSETMAALLVLAAEPVPE